MPEIRNKTQQVLNLRIGIELDAGATVEITDEQAAVLAGHPLLEITGVDETAAAAPATPPAPASLPTATGGAAVPPAPSSQTNSTDSTTKQADTAAAPEEDQK